MLRGLTIHDMLIIDRLELDVRPGLNVLTGETGAGKSILLDSLGFVLGWRGRAELVRAGAKQGEVTASFDLPPDHPARAVLAEKTEHFAFPQTEGQAGDRNIIAKGFVQVLQLKHLIFAVIIPERASVIC